MSLNDIYAAQIESHYFFYIALGMAVLCICSTLLVSAHIIADALLHQKVVQNVPVYDPSARFNHWLNQSVMDPAQNRTNGCVN